MFKDNRSNLHIECWFFCVWLRKFWFHKWQGISWLSCDVTAHRGPGPPHSCGF